MPRTGTWRCSSALWATDESADRLAQAIHGRGAFRRFKDALADSDDLLARWYGLSDDRHRGRARAWLADEGYTPTPTKPSDA